MTYINNSSKRKMKQKNNIQMVMSSRTTPLGIPARSCSRSSSEPCTGHSSLPSSHLHGRRRLAYRDHSGIDKSKGLQRILY